MRRFLCWTILLTFAAFALSAQDPHPSARLSWAWSQGTGDPATGFHLQRSLTTGGPYTVVGTIPAGTLTFLDTSVIVSTTYYYVVTAYNAAGDSAKSAEVSCAIPFQVPATPTGLSGTVK